MTALLSPLINDFIIY